MELGKAPKLGLLHSKTFFSLRSPYLVQYWRSFDDLERYARAHEAEHWPAWLAFNKRMKGARGFWIGVSLIVLGWLAPASLAAAGEDPRVRAGDVAQDEVRVRVDSLGDRPCVRDLDTLIG